MARVASRRSLCYRYCARKGRLDQRGNRYQKPKKPRGGGPNRHEEGEGRQKIIKKKVSEKGNPREG